MLGFVLANSINPFLIIYLLPEAVAYQCNMVFPSDGQWEN